LTSEFAKQCEEQPKNNDEKRQLPAIWKPLDHVALPAMSEGASRTDLVVIRPI
jgi:hypothetical protein